MSDTRPEEVGDASDAESDEILFPYKIHDEVKPFSGEDEEDEEDSDRDDNSGSNDDDGGMNFDSSPELNRVRRSKKPDSLDSTGMDAIDFSSDEEEERKAVPKRRWEMDDEAMKAIVDAKVEDNLMSDASDGESWSMSAAEDREFQRKVRDRLKKAEQIDLPKRKAPSGGARGGASKTAAKAAEAVKQAAAARSKRELDARRVKLTMVRSKTRRHAFHTKLGSRVAAIEDACREQVALVSFDEQDADLSLYHEDVLLDPLRTLADLGLRRDATIRLEVEGGEGPVLEGDPLTLVVKVEGGKPFEAEITTKMKFKTFMEGFITAVGIPLERASECVFVLDGDKLNPEGTPQGEDLEAEDQIDARFPADVMAGVQASPNTINLKVPSKKKTPATREAPPQKAAITRKATCEEAKQAVPEQRVTRSTTSRDDPGDVCVIDSDGVIVLD